jgi:hypothetical protein
MQRNSFAALAALFLSVGLLAQTPNVPSTPAALNVPNDMQGSRTDALVIVTNAITGTPVQEAAVTFVIPVTKSLYTTHTDANGVAYCGDRDSQLSVFELGQDSITFAVDMPGFETEKVSVELPPVEGKCVNVTKAAQTFAVALWPHGQRKEEHTTAVPPPVADCEYREVFVRSFTALCEESTSNYASVFITHGVCASPIDWSNTTTQTKQFETSFSLELEQEAQVKIGKLLGAKLKQSVSISGAAEWSYTSTVVFQGKLGVNPLLNTLCGHACMNASQKVIVTQRERRCCVTPGTLYGCNQWGPWIAVGQPIETRVNTGYCTTEAALYPCANPPSPLPRCAQ